jgi:predicted transcriptional regulator
MTTIIIDDSSTDGRELIESLRSKEFATILDANTEEDWWDTISQQERDDIEEGLDDIRNGRTVPHEEVMKKYAKWL